MGAILGGYGAASSSTEDSSAQPDGGEQQSSEKDLEASSSSAPSSESAIAPDSGANVSEASVESSGGGEQEEEQLGQAVEDGPSGGAIEAEGASNDTPAEIEMSALDQALYDKVSYVLDGGSIVVVVVS